MSYPQCPGLRSLYHAAKLRQLRAIAGDPNSAPARVAQANEEIRKLADSLYRDRECGPTALIARLEREGIEEVERTLAGRTDAPAPEAIVPRPSVMDFTRRMELTLRRHDAKKGGQKNWRKDDPDSLLARLRDELGEVYQALHRSHTLNLLPDESPASRAADELIDVANFAMMAHDVLVPLADDAGGAQ